MSTPAPAALCPCPERLLRTSRHVPRPEFDSEIPDGSSATGIHVGSECAADTSKNGRPAYPKPNCTRSTGCTDCAGSGNRAQWGLILPCNPWLRARGHQPKSSAHTERKPPRRGFRRPIIDTALETVRKRLRREKAPDANCSDRMLFPSPFAGVNAWSAIRRGPPWRDGTSMGMQKGHRPVREPCASRSEGKAARPTSRAHQAKSPPPPATMGFV